MSEVARRAARLTPLSQDLKPEVLAWTVELRAQFSALGMSISEFCRLSPVDKGTVSRYLNGKRVPIDRWFLNEILGRRASMGVPVTEEVRGHLENLQVAALKAAHPYEYKVRKLKEELETAIARRREAERYAQTLEEQLKERSQDLLDLLGETDRMRVAWDEDRAQFQRGIIDLTHQIELAREQVRQADQQVHELEQLLDRLRDRLIRREYTFQSDVNRTRADLEPLDGLLKTATDAQIAEFVKCAPNVSLNLVDPQLVAELLGALVRVGADVQIAKLLRRSPGFSLNLIDPQLVAELLGALVRVDADGQIAKLLEQLTRFPLDLDDPCAVIGLLAMLVQLEAKTQIADLLERIPAIRADGWCVIVRLLDAFRWAHAASHAEVLIECLPHLPLPHDNPHVATELLMFLHLSDASEQIEEIAERVALEVSLDDQNALAVLLQTLRLVGAHRQALKLSGRSVVEANPGPNCS